LREKKANDLSLNLVSSDIISADLAVLIVTFNLLYFRCSHKKK
jgi:hypothetical protein